MEPFVLEGEEWPPPELGDSAGDELEFIFAGTPTGWTEQDSRTLEQALDLAGIVDPAERLKIEMAMDLLGVVILRPLVHLAEGFREQIRDYFNQIKGGIGR